MVLQFDQMVKDPRLTNNAFPFQYGQTTNMVKDPRHHGEWSNMVDPRPEEPIPVKTMVRSALGAITY